MLKRQIVLPNTPSVPQSCWRNYWQQAVLEKQGHALEYFKNSLVVTMDNGFKITFRSQRHSKALKMAYAAIIGDDKS